MFTLQGLYQFCHNLQVRVISQETFDEIVKENMDEFGLEKDEAIKEAIKEFESQVNNLHFLHLLSIS